MTRTGLRAVARCLPRGLMAMAVVACSPSTAAHGAVQQVSSEPSESGGNRQVLSGAPGPNAQYVLKLGAMRNGSGVRGEEMGRVLHEAVRIRARALEAAAVVEDDADLSPRVYEKHLPVVTLDGLVTRIVESNPGGALQVLARVEFAVRREQLLKATLSGAATSYANGTPISEAGRRRLEDQAVDGAVQSALRGATPALFLSVH